MRAGLPVNERLTTVSASPPSVIASLWNRSIPASSVARNAVPTHAPRAPSIIAAATPRPSEIPPAPITGTRSPTASTTCGISEKVPIGERSEEHTSELQSLMRISYAVFCLKKKKNQEQTQNIHDDKQKYT